MVWTLLPRASEAMKNLHTCALGIWNCLQAGDEKQEMLHEEALHDQHLSLETSLWGPGAGPECPTATRMEAQPQGLPTRKALGEL